MSLLSKFKQLSSLKEQVTSGGDVCIAPMPLFSQLVSQTKSTKVKPKLKRARKLSSGSLGLKEALDGPAQSSEPDIDQASVMANLKKLEKRETVDRSDTAVYGLEDDDGQTVKVWIKHSQAKDFENVLQQFMQDREHSEDHKDIAEILYMIKGQFDIVDVQWPNTEEDEEQQTEIQADGTSDSQQPDDTQDANAVPQPTDLNLSGADDGSDAESKTVLQQVIDMMKADAEARKADAEARKAEAKAKEADLAVRQAVQRVKQEEEFLDMEAHDKAEKSQEKEAKRLAQLARWKRQTSGDDASEDEEYAPRPRAKGGLGGRVTPHDVASFIIGRVK